MLLSLALALLFGMLMSTLCKRVHIPGLLGMIFSGILLGPYALNWLDSSLLLISSDLRQIALIIILTRAGLTLDIADLKRVGRPAFLMSFIPATLEIMAITILAPRLLGLSFLDSLLLGTVVAAVSPAVIVPKMITIIEKNYGTKKSIPQLILAAATVDDVFVIVLFTGVLGLVQGQGISMTKLASVPLSITFGIVVGLLCGIMLHLFFRKVRVRDTQKVLIILALSFLLVSLENALSNTIAFSGLIAIMSLGIMLKARYSVLAIRLSNKFSKLWVFAELILFVLLGASVNISYVQNAGPFAVVLILCVLAFRILGVFISLIKTPLSYKEKVFCAIAYIPKATVQAAIGGIPLSVGIASGETILTVAVLSILITAPLGAIVIEISYKKLLDKN